MPIRTRSILHALPTALFCILGACGGDPTTLGTLPRGHAAPPVAARVAAAAAGATHAQYLSSDEAAALEQAAGGAVRITVGCCGQPAIDLATMTAYALQATGQLPAGTPVLVDGDDLSLAARVAERLQADGMQPVHVVTP
jgi:hypothetical protein